MSRIFGLGILHVATLLYRTGNLDDGGMTLLSWKELWVGRIRTFRFPVNFEVVVQVREIDEEVVEGHKKSMNNPTLAADPMTTEMLERDRRLLEALRARPELLLRRAMREASISIDYLAPADESFKDLCASQMSDEELIQALRDALPAEDVAEYLGLCEDNAFFDNAGFFIDAFKVDQVRFALGPATESGESE